MTQSRNSGGNRPFALLFSAAFLSLGMLTTSVTATDVPKNLGNGLDRLLESRLALSRAQAKRGPSKTEAKQTFLSARGVAYTTEESAKLADQSVEDESGRILVRINPDGTGSARDTAAALSGAISSLTVTAIDETYRGVGVMNAFVSMDDVAALAGTRGVRSVILELRPRHNAVRSSPALKSESSPDAVNGQVLNKLGLAFDQGVTQHRVDQINKFYNPLALFDFQGTGMSIGFMSDSYDTRALNSPPTPRAPTDVNSFDLPGSSSNPVNTQPVVVLQDFAGATDEGRAMGQIIYKMAPKARIAFATADLGEVSFANNIRALAGITGFTFPAAVQQGFKADTICDDVGYFDEPFFQDGIIGQGVDDAAAAGVSYFSSAANDIGVNGYDSDLRWVANGTGVTAAAGNAALAGTNINLTGVDPALYAGGFHNFNPSPGQLDVAQTVNIASNANEPDTIMQWDEPYDQNTQPNLVQPPLYTNSGTITSSQTTITYNDVPDLTAGVLYEIDGNAAAGSSVDVTVTVIDPNGNTIISQDNTVDEVVRFFAPLSGHYTLRIGRFSTTTGAFTVTVYASTGFTGRTISTDINLLVFNATTGAYIASSSLTANNFATNQPIELGFTLRPTGATQVQYVISRANVPASGGATHIRYQIPGNGLGGVGPAEYFTYDTVTTSGHATAAGCNGTAAYSVFRPSIPESFTSPGPATIFFDKLGNRLATPDVRLQPRVAAADAGNTTFFSGESGGDPDTSSNFSGTSAAAPHAAAIAALVLQAHGGSGSVTPVQMTRILQQTAFTHDLDPSFASGTARASNGAKITISVISDGSSNTGTGQNDNNAMNVAYIGPSSLATLVFNPQGTAATAGNVSGGNNGVNYTGNGSTFPTVTYFENSFPGMVFAPATKAFTIGSGSTVTAANITGPTFTNQAPSPSVTGQTWTMNLAFPTGNFTGGNVLRFNIGRSIQHSAATGTTIPVVNGSPTTAANPDADLVGGGVSLPSGTVVNDGMTFSGTTTDGGTFSGVIRNRLGSGYSKLDGFGFINAEAAAILPIP